MEPVRKQELFQSVERNTELPMLLLAVLMIPLLLVPIAVDLPDRAATAIVTADWAIWAIFAVELGVKTYLAPSARGYLLRHWFDVLIVVLPFLRPLRVLRSLRAGRALRATRFAVFAMRTSTGARAVLSRHGLHYSLALVLTIVLVLSAAITFFERSQGGTIDNFGTALWWAAATVTTVGYGDAYPVSPEGRGIAVVLMLVGVGLFSVLTANLASFFVESERQETEVTLEDVMAELKELRRRIDSLNSAGAP